MTRAQLSLVPRHIPKRAVDNEATDRFAAQHEEAAFVERPAYLLISTSRRHFCAASLRSSS